MDLRRELGLLHATMMGLGSTICAGIFVVLGQAVAIAGPAVILSFLFCGIINVATMLSYCELGAAMPRVGGEYAYAKEAFKGLPSFLTGWYEWSSNVFYATLMVLGSAYMLSYLMQINKFLIIIILVIIFTAINIKGIKEAGTTQTLLTSILLAIIFLFVGAGLTHSFRSNAFEPFMLKGPLSMIAAIAFIFETYLGVEAIAAAQAEIKEPEKTIPRAMILCSLILIIVYCLVVYVTVGILSPDVLSKSPTPLNLVAETTMGSVGVILLTTAGLIAALTSLNSAIIASSRAAYAMSQNGHFPKALRKVHKHCKTPYVAIISGSIFIIFFSIIDNLEFVVYSINFGFLIGFSLVNLSLIKLRRSKPYLNRPFKTPLYPLMPIIGIITSLMLLAFFDIKPLVFGIIWGLFGSMIYFFKQKSERHST
ncbi:MAG: APC family permease [Candidatus Bathyarchaeota archaeon]|nr:APC family permease [Candidatus Bathyarchaeota archaeon]